MNWSDWDKAATALCVWREARGEPIEGQQAIVYVIVVECCFNGSLLDNSLGATHYFNPSVVLPAWAAQMTKTVSIGHHDFYR